MILKAGLFDLDGTLLDTEHFQFQSWNVALEKMNIPHRVSEQDYSTLAGNSGNFIEDALVQQLHLPIRKGQLLALKEEAVNKLLAQNPLLLLPFALEALRFFVRNKLTRVCASSGPRDEIVHKLKKTGLDIFFNNRIASRDDVSAGKPYPEIYLFAADIAKCKPQDAAAFEDTPAGAQSASSAGCLTLAVPNKFCARQDFSMADGVFSDLGLAIQHIRKMKKAGEIEIARRSQGTRLATKI